MMLHEFLNWESLWGTCWKEGCLHLEFHCWFSWGREGGWREAGKVGIRVLGVALPSIKLSPNPLFSLPESYIWRIPLPVPKFPLSATKPYGFCLFRTSHISPVPRHCPVWVVTMKLLGNSSRPIIVSLPPDLPSFSNPFSTARETFPKGKLVNLFPS